MTLKQISKRKKIVLALMLISILLPVVVFMLNPLSTLLPIQSSFSIMIGYISIMLLLWQYLLGIRFIAARFAQDLVWINKIHKNIGIFGTLIIVSHPIPLILLNGPARYFPNLETNYGRLLVVGQLAMLFLVSTWFGSAFLRRRMSFRMWKRLHLFNYIILPLALIHSLGIGTALNFIPFLKIYFYSVAVVYILAVLLRVSAQFGIFKFKSRVVSVKDIATNVVEIYLSANAQLLNSKPGQFLYIQLNPFGESHPFTIAKVNYEDQSVCILPKIAGPFTQKLHDLKPGAEVLLDGPYGVFTREVSDNLVENPVFIAGGIGITPFISQINNLCKLNKPVYLFYANRGESDIALKDELDTLCNQSSLKVINVLSHQPDYFGEKGFVTSDLIKKYLGEDFNKSCYFICGPLPMIKMVSKDLKNSGISTDRIFSEEFSL